VADGAFLVGCERAARWCGAVGFEGAFVEAHAVHEDVTVGHVDRSRARSAVAPRHATVREHDVALRALTRAEAAGLDGRPPDQPAAAGVVVVRPGDEVETLARELEPGRERVRRRGLDLGRAQFVGVDPHLDHNRLPARPVCVQHVGHPGGVAHDGVVDRDARRRRPAIRRFLARQHDDPTAERVHDPR